MNQYPLSQAQKLWLTQGQAANQAQTLVLQLSETDSETAFQHAWAQLAEQQDILSMQFVQVAGVTLPVMQVQSAPVSIQTIACENTSLQAAQESLPALTLEAPLTVHLIHHDSGSSVVLRALPCLLDAMSMQLLIEALQAVAAGEECDAIDEECITQFPDFCAWLQDLQEDEDAVEAQQFWRAQQIADASGQLFEQQNTAKNAAAQEASSPAHIKQVTRSISAAQTHALQDWALTNSAFDPEEAEAGAIEQAMLFLVRTQQQRIGLGQPALYWLHDCRLDYDELSTCFGPMARPLAITHNIDLTASNAEAWQAWQHHAMEVLEAQENVPDIALEPFMAMQFLPEITIDGTRDILQWDNALLNVPITLQARQDQGALQLTWHYDSALFTEAAVQQMANGLLTLVSELLQAPVTTAVATLRMADVAEPTPVFATNSAATLSDTLSRDIPSLLSHIQHQAQQNPNVIALQNGSEQLSYSGLWQQVSNVSAAIASASTVDLTQNPVGIYLERGVSAVVSMLATWASNSFYVVLDTDWPSSRLSAVAKQAKPAVIVGSAAHQLSNSDTPLVDIQEALTTTAPLITEVARTALQSDLAYLLFTSGSTGTPKGVQVTQRNLAHYVDAATQQLDLARYQQFLHCATFSADMGHTVLFPALAQGKTVHIPAMQTLTNGAELGEYIHAHNVDVIKYVPSHLQALLSSAEGSKHSVLPKQCLILGGEPCSGQLLNSIQFAAPQLQVFNHYGPTETTVGVAIHAVNSPADTDAKSLPLTASLGDNRIYLLTANGHNATFGEVGEVIVQGSNVSAGYRGDVTGSAADAYITLNDQPAYRTGDLARLNSRGELQLAGRADHQVKIRGYRVELGDIEACLASAEGVTHAAVKMQPQGESQWLIAYASGNNLNEDQLNAWLAERLPEMMLPQRIVLLDTMPLLASGKIDRQQLPSIDALASQDLGTCEPPANDVEFVIHSVFKQVLGMDEVGVTWDFFAIGGHSLSAIKITGQLRKQLQIDLPPGLLFEHSSIRKLAIAAQSRESEPGKLAAVAKIRRQLASMTPEQIEALKAKQAAQQAN